jgi:hypothetical protein
MSLRRSGFLQVLFGSRTLLGYFIGFIYGLMDLILGFFDSFFEFGNAFPDTSGDVREPAAENQYRDDQDDDPFPLTNKSQHLHWNDPFSANSQSFYGNSFYQRVNPPSSAGNEFLKDLVFRILTFIIGNLQLKSRIFYNKTGQERIKSRIFGPGLET